jgi:curli production assembly/transport component CsgF
MTILDILRCNSGRLRHVALVSAAFVAIASPALAGTMVYTPTNPTFGGNALNGSTLFSAAQAQNQFTKSASSGAPGSSGALTPGQIFAQQLTSQLYSSLANKITQAIFGANAQTSGTFTFEGTTITYKQDGGNIDISINDGQSITNVSVPAGP